MFNGTISHAGEKLTAGRDATLTAKNIRQDGASQINAARDIAANARDTLKTQGQMTAGQNLTVSSNTLTQDGKLLAKNSAQLNAGTLHNRGTVQGASLRVDSSTLSNSGSMLSGGNLAINTQDFTQSGSTGAKGKAEITASGKLSNTGSLVSDDVLEYIIKRVRAIPHVEIVRLGSRTPVVCPQRITPELCEMLKK